MSQEIHNAYTTHQRENETPRETEAQALLSCASKLEAVRQTPNCAREQFLEAIQHNQELWTLFQVCLCEPDNPLPHDLKILLLNISRYVDKTSFRAVAEGNADLLISLININRNIAAGLRVKPPEQIAAEKPTQSAPPPPPPEGTVRVSINTSA